MTTKRQSTITYKVRRDLDKIIAQLAQHENRSKTKQLSHMIETYLAQAAGLTTKIKKQLIIK